MSTTHNPDPSTDQASGPPQPKYLVVSSLAVIACCRSRCSHAQGLTADWADFKHQPASNVCTGAGWFSAPGATTICENAIVSCPKYRQHLVSTSPNTKAHPASLNGVINVLQRRRRNRPCGATPTGTPDRAAHHGADLLRCGLLKLAGGLDCGVGGNGSRPVGQAFPRQHPNGACRPATFINWVYNNVYLPITQQGSGGNPKGGNVRPGIERRLGTDRLIP